VTTATHTYVGEPARTLLTY